jgi:site-specific recombinase XerD
MILILLDTGLRLSEISNIKLRDIDLDRETIRVMGKGAQERLVRIGKTTQKALMRYILVRTDDYEELWISQEHKPMTIAGIQIILRRLCNRAEITDAKRGPHSFRHTAATACLRNGMPETYVQTLLGHRDLRMTRRYTRTINSDDVIKAHISASPVDRMGLR